MATANFLGRILGIMMMVNNTGCDVRPHPTFFLLLPLLPKGSGGGGVLPYMSYMGMCPVNGMVFRQLSQG